MRYLLDTHLLLWLLASPRRVPKALRDELQAGAGNVYFSVTSLWEIAIKFSLGRLSFEPGIVRAHAERGGFERLAIEPVHVEAVARLPWHHRDPFDRLLVAQSASESMLLLSSDRQLEDYGPTVRLVHA